MVESASELLTGINGENHEGSQNESGSEKQKSPGTKLAASQKLRMPCRKNEAVEESYEEDKPT